jgi:uncharacterized protein
MTTLPVSPPRAWRRAGSLLAPGLLVLVLWLATGWLVPVHLAGRSAQVQGLVTTFLGIFIEALPFLLAGVVASVLIQQFVTPTRLTRLLPRHVVGATLVGTLLGLAFPVCECGAIPASRRLVRKGAPPATGIAFALAAPVVNPIVIISTTIAFADWRWAAARVGLTIVIAMIIGLILGMGFHPAQVLVPAALPDAGDAHVHGPTCDHDHAAGEVGWRGMLAHGSAEFFEMSQYLVVGGLLAATMQTFVPQSWFLSLTQDAGLGIAGPLVAIVVLMLVAVVLSVCSTVDAFLALSFLGLVHPGAIMAFLVFGPMIDIKSTFMLASTFRRTTVAAMVVLAFGCSIVAGLVTMMVLQ